MRGFFLLVFPAQAGVFPSIPSFRTLKRRLPRASGGVSERADESRGSKGVFPAQAGVFPVFPSIHELGCGLPRASGGVSMGEDESTRVAQVFPAQAGVFPNRAAIAGRSLCLPRASGGVSITGEFELNNNQSSPRKRGCFPFEGLACPSPQVFPAQAGVFLPVRLETLEILGLPRASGGVSRSQSDHDGSTWSSPRKRGCFRLDYPAGAVAEVFPAQAGVFLAVETVPFAFESLPRASGGVSERETARYAGSLSSPRKRGCFQRGRGNGRRRARLPRASGGVSNFPIILPAILMSSPRKRGCFSH